MARFSEKHSRYSELKRAARARATQQAQEALVEVMTIAACVDGSLEEGEADALKLQIMATPGFDHMDAKALSQTVEAVAVRVANEGLAARVRHIAHAIGDDPHTREEAFALATLFVLFDGEVGDEEQEFLEMLQRELHISDDRASHITSVLADLEE